MRRTNHALDAAEKFFEYRGVIRSHRASDARQLTDTLGRLESVREFRIYPTGD